MTVNWNKPQEQLTADDLDEFFDHVLVPRLQELTTVGPNDPMILAVSVLSLVLKMNKAYSFMAGGTVVTDEQMILYSFYLGMIAEREGWFLEE